MVMTVISWSSIVVIMKLNTTKRTAEAEDAPCKNMAERRKTRPDSELRNKPLPCHSRNDPQSPHSANH
eukprot:3657021-Amphidinium_carterae.1